MLTQPWFEFNYQIKALKIYFLLAKIKLLTINLSPLELYNVWKSTLDKSLFLFLAGIIKKRYTSFRRLLCNRPTSWC